MPNYTSKTLIDGSDCGVEVIRSPTNFFQLWDHLRSFIFLIVHFLFHHERGISVWIWNTDKDDCSALVIGKVNAFTGLSAANTKKNSLVSILCMILIVVDLLKTPSLLEKLLLLDLLFELA
jgi:hypothetical protein